MNSVGSMPFARAVAISSDLICLEALAISVVLLIKEAMPVPEPPPDTDIFVSGLISWYCSAQAKARFTIVSEPVLLMNLFESEEGDSSVPGCEEQAHKTKMNTIM